MNRMMRLAFAGIALSVAMAGSLPAESAAHQAPPGTPAAIETRMLMALGDYAQALRVWRPLAEQGDPEGQLNLGLAYLWGRGVMADEGQAVAWIRKAADQGFAPAQSSLADYYGAFVDSKRRDLRLAMEWDRKAADQGDASGQYAVCTTYLGNELTPKDDALALRWCQLAAEQGHTRAQYELGRMYAEGRGTPVDKAKALLWLRRAAENGLYIAHFDIEQAGGREAYVETLADYRSRAERGEARAQASLANVYYSGLLVPEDQAIAFQWWRKSAEQGDAEGALSLGEAYLHGLGTERDFIQAYKWLSLGAVWLGEVNREFSEPLFYIRDGLAQDMTAAQLAEARRQIREAMSARS